MPDDRAGHRAKRKRDNEAAGEAAGTGEVRQRRMQPRRFPRGLWLTLAERPRTRPQAVDAEAASLRRKQQKKEKKRAKDKAKAAKKKGRLGKEEEAAKSKGKAKAKKAKSESKTGSDADTGGAREDATPAAAAAEPEVAAAAPISTSASRFLERHGVAVAPPEAVASLPEPVHTFELAEQPFGKRLVRRLQKSLGAGATPTAVQAVCWGLAAGRRDLIGVAETGAGAPSTRRPRRTRPPHPPQLPAAFAAVRGRRQGA